MDTEEKKEFEKELLSRISQMERGNESAIGRMAGRDDVLAGAVVLGCLAAVVAGYFLT